MKAVASGFAALLLLIVPLLSPLLDAVIKNGPACALDAMALFSEPAQRISASAEAIDRQAQAYNSVQAALIDAEEVQQAIYNSTIESGMDLYPSHLSGIPATRLRDELEPQSIDLSPYADPWNLAITDLQCMLELDCISVCSEGGCSEFSSVYRGTARLPSVRPDLTARSYLEGTRKKLELFIQAYHDALDVVDGQRTEFLKQQSSLKKNIGTAALQMTPDYPRTRSILLELGTHYCTRTYPLPDPSKNLLKARSSYQQFETVLTEVDNDPFYDSPSSGWLYHRVQRLTNASLSLALRNELMASDVLPSIENHQSLSECILSEASKQAQEALELSGSDRPLYEVEKASCEALLAVPSTIDSEARASECLVEYVIKPVKGEALDVDRLRRKHALARSLFLVAVSPAGTTIDVDGEELQGEDLRSYVLGSELDEIEQDLQAQSSALDRIPFLSVKDASASGRKIDEAFEKDIARLKDLDDDAHKSRVNSLWSSVELGISKTDERLAWLHVRGVDPGISTQPEKDYLSDNVRFMADGITAFRAFGHMNRLRGELDGLVAGLAGKRAELNPQIASRLQPFVQLPPLQSRLNQRTTTIVFVSVDNPFPDETFTTQLKIEDPLFSKAIDAVVTEKGYSSKFEQSVIPITGSESTRATASNHPSNTVMVSKTVSFTSPHPADLEVPLGVSPYDLDCGAYACDLEGKSAIVRYLHGQGTLALSASGENPVKLELGARSGADQILSITNPLPFDVAYSATLLSNDTNPVVTDIMQGSSIGYVRNPSASLITFTLNLPSRSLRWVKISSSGENSLPSSNPPPSTVLKQRVPSNHTFEEAMDLLWSAREDYHLAKFASKEHPGLVLVNLNFLESLLSSAQAKLSKNSADAYDSASLALNHTGNATDEIAKTIYDETLRLYFLLEQAGFNTTQLDSDVSRLQEHQSSHDVHSTILLGSQVLRSMGSVDMSRAVQHETVESPSSQIALENSKPRASVLETPLSIPWWIPTGAVLALTSLSVYVFKDRIPQVGHELGQKLDAYEKKAEEDEMEKYNL